MLVTCGAAIVDRPHSINVRCLAVGIYSVRISGVAPILQRVCGLEVLGEVTMVEY